MVSSPGAYGHPPPDAAAVRTSAPGMVNGAVRNASWPLFSTRIGAARQRVLLYDCRWAGFRHNAMSVGTGILAEADHRFFGQRTTLILIAGLLLLIGGGFAGWKPNSAALDQRYALPSLASCVDRQIGTLRPERLDTDLIGTLVRLCYSQIHGQGLLNDFQIRRAQFLHHYQAQAVILWMLVAITISGVILAGIQLVASYRLAAIDRTSLEHGTEVMLQQDKISLKSSFVGLAILAISLAFFALFVFKVFKLEETNPDRTVPAQSGPVLLSPGGLGKPPATGEAGVPSK